MRIFTILIIFSGFLATSGLAESSDSSKVSQLYQSGVESYQAGEFKKANELFQSAWSQDPENALILYNWGLSEYRLENIGMAVAAWRKALSLAPRFSPAREALEFVEPKLPRGPMSSGDEEWETFRNYVLVPFQLDHFLILATLFLGLSGWLILRYIGRRRRALLEEQPLPPFPVYTVIATVVFLLSLTLVGLKTYDLFHPRATVIEDTLSVRSLPDSEANELFKLQAGAEVMIRRVANEWTQVSYPGGMTGWVPRQSLFHTSGRQPW